MLCLTRKRLEKIHLSGGITIQVVRIEHDRVRLGIEAPDEVKIARDEMFDTDEELATFLGHPATRYKPVNYPIGGSDGREPTNQ